MPNTFFVAKRAWEHGDPRRAIDLLVGHLAGHGVLDPFGDPDALLGSNLRVEFEEAVILLLTHALPGSGSRVLQVPLARVWVPLFELDPNQRWVDFLLQYDFYARPTEAEIDSGTPPPPAHSSGDLEYLADGIAELARGGLLSPDESERGVGGRPILTLADLDRVPVSRWRELLPLLQQRLMRAYAEAPADPWPGLLASDPRGVAERFVHDLIGRRRTPPTEVAARWADIRRRRPSYAKAAVSSLRLLLDDPDYDLIALARNDAGRVGQDHGWLHDWVEALDVGDGAPPA